MTLILQTLDYFQITTNEEQDGISALKRLEEEPAQCYERQTLQGT